MTADRTPAGRPSVDRPGAQAWVPEQPTLEGLRAAVGGCRGCELHADAVQAVMGEGPPDARLVLLGEQPGDREDREGRPFVGPAGRLLDEALATAGIDRRRDVYVTNVVKHFRFRPGPGKRRIHESPTRAHVAACAPWLSAELGLLHPRGAVLLGATAGKALYGSGFRVGEARGRLTDWPSGLPVASPPSWVLATLHPSAVLRAEDAAERERLLEGLVADLRVAAAALD